MFINHLNITFIHSNVFIHVQKELDNMPLIENKVFHEAVAVDAAETDTKMCINYGHHTINRLDLNLKNLFHSK